MPGRKLIVEIIGDARSFERALKKSSAAANDFNRSVTGTRKQAAAQASGLGLLTKSYVGTTTAALGLGVAVRSSFGELFEAQKVTAQTQAVLKSTGFAANVTAEDVERLGQSLLQLSGVDDEVIKRGENLLLTFRNIRNEAGPTNDIFNQATKAALDLSVAMGTDLDSAAIRVGKALNDPVRGITALRRVGVAFTAAQEAQIKALVKSGETLQAQKIILQELRAEFGGSAEAAGQTLPGELNKLRESAKNLGATVADISTPALIEFTDSANDLLTAVQQLRNPREGLPSLGEFFKGLGGNLPAGSESIPTIGPFLGALRGAFKNGGKSAAEGFTEGFAEAVATSPRTEAAAARAAAAISNAVAKARAQPGTGTPFLDFQQANAESTKSLLDDLAVIRRRIAVLQGRLARAGTLKAKTQIQNEINSERQSEAAILSILQQQKKAREDGRKEAAKEAAEARREAARKAQEARERERERIRERSDALKQAIQTARSEIGTLFQGPVVAPTDFQRKQALGVGRPGAGGLLADIRAQTAQALRFERDLKKLKGLGVGASTIDELRGLGTAVLPQIEEILRAPKGQQRQLVQALAAREAAARRIGNVVLQAQTVQIDKIVVPVRVDIDGRKVAEVVTTQQQKRNKAMPQQRSGRNAGQG